MAQMNFKLVVESDAGSDRVVYSPSVKPQQKLISALTEFAARESQFIFNSENKRLLPAYLTQVTFSGSVKVKSTNQFWQIAVNKDGTVTPIGLDNYVIQADDEVFLRFTTLKL